MEAVSYTHLDVYKRQGGEHLLSILQHFHKRTFFFKQSKSLLIFIH